MTEHHPFELDVCSNCEQVYRRPTPEMLADLAVKPELRVVYVVRGNAYPYQATAYRIRALDIATRRSRRAPGNYGDFVLRAERWLQWHDRRVRELGHSPFRRGE